MAKTRSKPSKKLPKSPRSSRNSSKAQSRQPANLEKSPKVRTAAKPSSHSNKSSKSSPSWWRRLKLNLRKFKTKVKTKWRTFRGEGIHLHRSFRRSYREDYVRDISTPGLLSHAMTTFRLIFKNWRIFIPFILIMTAMYILLVGLMSEDVYQQFHDSINESSAELANGEISNFAKAGLLLLSTITTGGLDTGMSEVQVVFLLLLFLIMWLVTIYLMRHLLSGGKPKLRDGLYNALAPFISTLLVIVVIFIQAVPAMLVVITYSAAVATDFLATPFYALIYFIFAALMISITTYLLSSSIIALVAVTAPGLYPMKALFSASDLMAGRRIRFLIRLIYLVFVIGLTYVIVMTPIILLDLLAKNAWEWLYGVPIVPCAMLIMTCFVFVYLTTYIYRYYRWLLEYKEN